MTLNRRLRRLKNLILTSRPRLAPSPRLGFDTLEDRTAPATLSTYLTNEHADLNLIYAGGPNGTWDLQPRNADTGIGAPADDTLLYVSPQAQRTRTGAELGDFSFIGAPVGGTYYELPQNQDPNLLYLGFAGYGASGDFDRYNPAAQSLGRASGIGRWLKMTLLDVKNTQPDGQPGTGTFAVWQNGSSGPIVFMSSYNDGVANPDATGLDATDGIGANDALWMLRGGHSHFSLGFSQPGRYEVTVQLSGYYGDGGVSNSTIEGTLEKSQPITLYFSVGSVGQLEFDPSSYTVNEGAGAASIGVRRLGGSDGRITANYTTADISAVAGADYTKTSGTLTFNDGETAKTIAVPILNDTLVEGAETLSLTLSSPGPSSIADYVSDPAADNSSLLAETSSTIVTIIDNDGTTNTPPTLSDIASQTTDEDVPKTVDLTVGDAETAPGSLLVTATSSDVTLVPNGNIVVGSSGGGNRTLSITPAANRPGTVTITATVTDGGGLTKSKSFSFTVNAVNDAPTISPLADRSTTIGTPVGPLAFTVNDIETPASSLTVSGTSSNLALVPNAKIVFSGSGANRSVTVTPAAGASGTAIITLTVADAGTLTATATFTLHVGGSNAPPVAVDDAFTLGAGNVVRGNVLFNDEDADDDALTAALGAAPAKGTVVLGADGAFTYTPGPAFAGSDHFTYTVRDPFGGTDTGAVAIAAAVIPGVDAVLDDGHTDVGIAYGEDGPGTWNLHIHDEVHDVEYEPEQAILFVGPSAAKTRTGGFAAAAYDFLGVAPGESFYRLPFAQEPNLLYLGFGAEEIDHGTFLGGTLEMRLKSVDGPGHFAVWTDTEFGPNVFMQTADGVTDADRPIILEGGHTHANWSFSVPGDYAITFEAVATLPDGTFVDSGDVTYHFRVDTTIATTTKLNAVPNATTGGSLVTFTATVAPTPGAVGTVDFLDNGNPIAAGSEIALAGGVATLQISALTAGTHSITAVYSGYAGFGASTSSALNFVVTAAPPQLVRVTPNGNLAALAAPQRSRVASLEVIFNQPVQLDPNALALALHTNNVSFNGVPQPSGFGTLPTSLSLATTDNVTWIVTFTGNTENGADGINSLMDGVYDLNITAAKVHPFGIPGLAMAANSKTTFDRLYGDTTPPETPTGGTTGVDYMAIVNTGDNLAFRAAFNRPAPAYRANLDFDGNGVINTGDNLQFRNRFNKALVWKV